MVLNGNMQSASAEEKMAEKKIMRAISRRRQKERQLNQMNDEYTLNTGYKVTTSSKFTSDIN